MANSELHTSSIDGSSESCERNAKEVLLGRHGHVLGVAPLHVKGPCVRAGNWWKEAQIRKDALPCNLFEAEMKALNRSVTPRNRNAVPWPRSPKPAKFYSSK